MSLLCAELALSIVVSVIIFTITEALFIQGVASWQRHPEARLQAFHYVIFSQIARSISDYAIKSTNW